jgi:hypothetical protein
MAISSPIPGMNKGKQAGQPCIHLDDKYRCKLFGKAERPKVCCDYPPTPPLCGSSRDEALIILS